MIVRIRHHVVLVVAIVAALFSGSVGTAQAPAQDIRQALAPTGKLRVGVYPGSPSSMVRDPTSGETKGLGFELGKEFARRLNVPFEPVELPRMAEVLEALKGGRVDFTVTNATAVRAAEMDFSPVILEVELGYLVLPGSPVSSLTDVDRPGIRVGVTEGSSSQGVLTRQFKNATVVPAQSLKVALELLSGHKIDAYATNKAALFEMSSQLPTSKVLDGRWGLEHFAIAVPKGRDRALDFLRKFAEDAKSEGLVKRTAEKAGLRGIAKPE